MSDGEDDLSRARRHRGDRDRLAFDVPNCPYCLRAMVPDAGGESWVCGSVECVGQSK